MDKNLLENDGLRQEMHDIITSEEFLESIKPKKRSG